MTTLTVGKLREKLALLGSDERVVLVTDDPELPDISTFVQIVDCYPDTMDERGNWRSTFKIKVRRHGIP